MPQSKNFVFFLVILNTIIPILLFGQYYNLGQDPSSLKWRQIQTPHFKLIYPENFEPKAQKMMHSLDFAFDKVTKTLAYKPGRIPFVIHNYNTEPNAVTAWAPKRVEVFTCPPQDSYAQDWLSQLVLHEYRHVVQVDRTNQGFTKVLSWFTGEQAATMINGLFVPSWFMEGDAVCTETALSRSGRGRLPSFEMPLRAQVIQKGAFSYDKASLGSYKSFVPNQYTLGYTLVANVRRNYGYYAWISALDEVARKPFMITPFNKGLKNATGKGKEALFSNTMFEMDSLWKVQDSKTSFTDFTQITCSEKDRYENYSYPYYLNDTLLIVQYSSLDEITRFQLTGIGGYKKIIIIPGFLSSEMYSVVRIESSAGDLLKREPLVKQVHFLLAWTETINDPRWGQRNYSVIRIFDTRTGKTSELTKKGRYFAPSFSPGGKSLVAVTVNPEGQNSVVIIDVETGVEKKIIIKSDTDFYMTPSWSEDGSMVVFTKIDDKGKSVNVFNLNNHNISTLVPAGYIDVANPIFAGEYVLFNGSFSGIENIYAVDLKSKQIRQVTSSRFGSCNADISPDGNKIIYSEYSSAGFSLAETVFDPASWIELSEIVDFSPSLYKHLLTEESDVLDNTFDTNTLYQSKPYKKGLHIFNFHSWAPAYVNYMSGENGAGVSFMSQNDLSTATTVVGYKWDVEENTGKATLDFSWQAWYPVIDINTSYGARTAYTDSAQRYNFTEAIISGGLSLPLTFTGGRYYKGIRIQALSSFYNITHNTSPLEDKLSGTINSFSYGFNAYRYIRQSYKDLYPRWGQTLTLAFSHSPFGDNDYGSIASVSTRFYFPGLLRHNGIKLDLNWQQRNSGTYSYSNRIILPRGYYNVYDEEIASFAFNYKFPFLYPDLALGPIVYFKRIKANLFLDGGIAVNNDKERKLQSTGVEVTSDLHLIRFVFPFDLGFRFGYQPLEKHYFFDFLFSVNLSN